MENFLSSLISDVIIFLLGVILSRLFHIVTFTIPSRRVWGLKSPKELVVCCANSVITDTGEYHRPATGIGEARSLSLLATSLSQTYGKIDFSKFYLSTDQIHKYIENDLIILGGDKTNELASRLLRIIEKEQPLKMKGCDFYWRKNNNGIWIDEGAENFRGNTFDYDVVSDYGVIVRVKSPFSSLPKTVILLAGSHTYGTLAASKFFTEKHLHKNIAFTKKDNIVILLRCEVINGYPTSLEVIKTYKW